MIYLVHIHSTSSELPYIHTTNDQTFFELSGFKLLDSVEKNVVLRKVSSGVFTMGRGSMGFSSMS